MVPESSLVLAELSGGMLVDDEVLEEVATLDDVAVWVGGIVDSDEAGEVELSSDDEAFLEEVHGILEARFGGDAEDELPDEQPLTGDQLRKLRALHERIEDR